MELFWQTIADYNTMTWPVQALIVLAAVVLTARLYLRPVSYTHLTLPTKA